MSVTATQVTQLTAPNQTVEAPNGVSYAYRRLGEPSASAPPLVSFQHFRGNLDNWDPALVDALARTREVILFDNAGVGGSTGTVPRTVTAMAHDALSFIEALELREIDVLGYSLGGYVAQELVLIRPRLVRRLVLAGTGPQGGEDMHGFSDEMFVHANRDAPGAEDVLALFFERSETSVAKGKAVPPAHLHPHGRPRHPRHARGAGRPAGRDHHMGDPRREHAQSPRRDHAAGARRQRRQRPPGSDEELARARRAPPERPAEDLPGCWARLPLPVPGRIRRRSRAVLERDAVGMSTRTASGRSSG